MKHIIAPLMADVVETPTFAHRSMSDADIVRQDIDRYMRTKAGATPAALAGALTRLAYKVRIADSQDFILDVNGYLFSCAGKKAELVG